MKNLNKRKMLAARVLKVGKGRILFDTSSMEEIKEAIANQDIRDLYNRGIIMIKPVKGRRKKENRKTRRGPGSIKVKVKTDRRDYIILTRKLRGYIWELRNQNKISRERYEELRRKIKAGVFKNKAHLKNYMEQEV